MCLSLSQKACHGGMDGFRPEKRNRLGSWPMQNALAGFALLQIALTLFGSSTF
jgi:hypothetical protein